MVQDCASAPQKGLPGTRYHGATASKLNPSLTSWSLFTQEIRSLLAGSIAFGYQFMRHPLRYVLIAQIIVVLADFRN